MKDLTQGPILRQLSSLAGKFTLNIVLATLSSLINVYWVGRLGADAQAAMTLALNPVMLLLMLAPVLSVGVRVLVAQAVGGRDSARAGRVFNEAFGASLIVMTLIAGVLWPNRLAFGSLLTADPATASLIAAYLRWLIPSVVLQVPGAVIGASLAGTGNLRPGLLVQAGALVLNVTLPPILMFGWLGAPRLGIEGAGLASLLTGVAGLGFLLLYTAGGRSDLRLQPRLWLARPTALWQVLRIGLPTGLEGGVLACYMTLVTVLLRPFGPVEQAAIGVASRLLQVALIPLMALGAAASVLSGHNFGAGLGRRVQEIFRATLILGLILAPLLCVALNLFSRSLSGVFSDDPAVVEGCTRFLQIVSFSLIPTSVVMAAFSVLSGLGNTRASLVTTTVYTILVVVPAWFLARLAGFRPDWLWELMVGMTVLEMLMALYFLRREFGRSVPTHASDRVAGSLA